MQTSHIAVHHAVYRPLATPPGTFDKGRSGRRRPAAQRLIAAGINTAANFFDVNFFLPCSLLTRLLAKPCSLLPQSSMGVFANGEMCSGVITTFSPITPLRRLTFTVKNSRLPGLPCRLAAHRSPAACPCLYINSESPTTVPAATAWTAHSGEYHSTPCTHNHYSCRRAFASVNSVKMARHFGQEARRSTHHAGREGQPQNITPANNTLIGRPQGSLASTRREGSRARETQRKRVRRDHRSELIIGRSPTPTVPLRRLDRLADRVTNGNGEKVRGSDALNGTCDPAPRLQQGNQLQERVTYDVSFDRHGGPVQSLSLPKDEQTQTTNTNDITTDNTDLEVDDFADLFGPDPLPPRPPREHVSTRPVQYGSAHHLPFNLHLHAPRPVQPASIQEPIRMVSSWTPHEPDIDGPLPGASTQPTFSQTTDKAGANRRPVNTYRGNDPVKRRVQNTLLRCILADKPLPKTRKKPDRMVLKCAGRREFR